MNEYTFKVDVVTTVTRILKIKKGAPVFNVAHQKFVEMFGEDRVIGVRLVGNNSADRKKLDFDYSDLNWSHWGER